MIDPTAAASTGILQGLTGINYRLILRDSPFWGLGGKLIREREN